MAVVLGAAFLDEHLRQVLANFVIDDKKATAELLENNGPLSTFSARTRAAYSLGLINKEERDDLNLIRKIRNRFAHDLHDLTFEDQNIVSWCYSLQLPKRLLSEMITEPGDLFIVAVAIHAQRIALLAIEIKMERRAKHRPTTIVNKIMEDS